MKKILTAVLIALLAISLTVPASASSAPEDQKVSSCCFGELKRTVQYVNEGGRLTICEVYGLSSAQKISALVDALYPVNQIEDELRNLEHYNNPDVARYEAVFSGMGSLDSYLVRDSDASRALSVVPYNDAVELMTVIGKTEDYRTVPEVKYFVDSYLNQTLSGNQLRAGLKALTSYGYAGPDHDVSIDEMDAKALIAYAHQIVETEEFQALMAPLSEVRSGNADTYALTCRYTTEELNALWEELAEAASIYQPGQVKMLENMTFTIPIEIYTSIDAWEPATGK